MALASKTFNEIITFTRAGGATRVNAAGHIVGVDFSTTSNTIGTGTKTFTLLASAAVSRSYAVGDLVLITDHVGGGTMTGAVSAYTASSQTLEVSVASVTGSGTSTDWRIGNRGPRFDHDPVTLAPAGLLIEEQRTNILTWSSDFRNTTDAGSSRPWQYSNATVSHQSALAPNGSQHASKLVVDSASGVDHKVQSGSSSVTSGNTYVASIFAKAVELSKVSLQLSGAANWPSGNPQANFDLVAGSVISTAGAASAGIVPHGNGWFRLWVIQTASGSGNSGVNVLGLNAAGQSVFPGDGTSGVLIWGAQLEAGSVPTSHIPSRSAQVTRSPDAATVPLLSSWHRISEGTYVLEAQKAYPQGVPSRYMELNSGAGNEDQIYVTNDATQDRVGAAVIDNTVSQMNGSSGVLPSGALFKLALAVKMNDFALAVNGVITTIDTSGTAPDNFTRFTIGNADAGGNRHLNGRIRGIKFYPRRLTNAELQALTL